MLRKTMIAGAALLTATFGTLATVAPAQAKTDVHVGIYVGAPGPIVWDPWEPWDYWVPGAVYVPGYYYRRPHYRRAYRPRRPYIRHVRHRRGWREVCTIRKVRVRYWNGYRWRWRTVRKKTRCRWVRR